VNAPTVNKLPDVPVEPTLYYITNKEQLGTHGFVRSLCKEYYTCISFQNNFLEDGFSNHEISNDEISNHESSNDESSNDELLETVCRLGLQTNVILNGKLATHVHLNIPQNSKLPNSVIPYHMEFSKPGDFNSGEFVQTIPRKGKLCKISYAALNFRDVMVASGKITKEAYLGYSKNSSGIGLEFSGICDDKPIMGFGLEAIGNYINTDYIWDIPSSMNLAEAATLPVVYLTVYYAFLRSKLSKGQSILIHAGTGGVGQAAIRVALDIGCEIFTTCQKNKIEYLQKLFPEIPLDHIGDSRSNNFEDMIMHHTKGKGVNMVLNSLADDKLQTGFRCVKQHGHFCEIGKYDLTKNSSLGMKKFLGNITFHGIDLDQVFENPEVMNEITMLFNDGLNRGVVKPSDYTVYPVEKIADALSFLGSGKHKGKVLIDIQDRSLLTYTPKYYTSGTHLITGGLGGFGMVLSRWLIERGAEKLILSTRSGITSGEQKLFVDSNHDKIIVIVDDLTNINNVHKLVKQYGHFTGIWHLAMVLKDTLLKTMTMEKWQTVINTKALIAENLNLISCNDECKDFVCFSSITSKSGNPGQSNYAFANNQLEEICKHRKNDGYSGLSIQWGAIGNVGAITRMNLSKIMKENLEKEMNILDQSIKSCMMYLEKSLLYQSSYTVLSSSRPYVEKNIDDNQENNNQQNINILETVGKILRVDLSQIDKKTQLSDVGLDSMTAAEIHGYLVRVTKEIFPMTDMSKMTIDKLSKFQDKVKIKTVSQTKPTAHINLESIKIIEEPVEEPLLVVKEPLRVVKEPLRVVKEPLLVVEEPLSVVKEPLLVSENQKSLTDGRYLHHFSLLHAIFAIFTSLLAISTDYLDIICTNQIYLITMFISFFYVISDSVVHHKNIKEDKTALIHHLLFGIVDIYNIIYPSAGYLKFSVKMLCLFETSTLFYNLSHIYKTYKLIMMFAISFFITRILTGSIMFIPEILMYYQKEKYFAVFITTSIYLLQLYWFKGISKMARSQYIRNQKQYKNTQS
jgi:NADPH:quinone reductase-like Zn-dependent oxidoreductase